jgi:hypothetical protein
MSTVEYELEYIEDEKTVNTKSLNYTPPFFIEDADDEYVEDAVYLFESLRTCEESD